MQQCEGQDGDCVQDLARLNISFIQSRLSLTQKGLPFLKKIGKSYFSTDPEESARFMQKYMGLDADDPKVSLHLPGSAAAGARVEEYRVFFIKPSTSAADDITRQVARSWAQAMTAHAWSPWGDFHDGVYGLPHVNLTRIYEDGIDDWYYDPGERGYARWYIPSTTWTWEFQDFTSDNIATGHELDCEDGTVDFIFSKNDGRFLTRDGNEPCGGANNHALDYLSQHSWSRDQPGRGLGAGYTDAHTHTLWWKVAYATKNASQAKDFAMDALGAQLRDCPYAYPADIENGFTGAFWLYAIAEEKGGLELHFVESANMSERKEIADFTTTCAQKAQELVNGCLHPLMLNNLIFEVATLDPFVEKLEAWNAPYLAVKDSNDYALIFAFPGNEAIVMQLRSSILSSKARSLSELTDSC